MKNKKTVLSCIKYTCVLAVVFVFTTLCKAQSEPEPSQAPQSITRNMIQDQKGNIWIASAQGIFRYDGKSFTNITGKVSSARFLSVLEDKKGNFWFSSVGSGVYYYDGKSFKNYTNRDGLIGNDISCIYEDKAGNIWFGTEVGASRYDGKYFRGFKMKQSMAQARGDSVHVSAYLQDNDVNSIIEDKVGKLWFGTKGGAYVYDGATFTVVANTNGKSFTNVNSIIEDKKGNIWLGGKDGLWRYNAGTFTSFTQNVINSIYQDKKGNIWTTSENAANREWVLTRYDEKSLADKTPVVTEIKSKYKGNKGMFYGILEAKDGSIWVGSGNGVYRYDGKTLTGFNDKEAQ